MIEDEVGGSNGRWEWVQRVERDGSGGADRNVSKSVGKNDWVRWNMVMGDRNGCRSDWGEGCVWK
jgi:hypothetical protein